MNIQISENEMMKLCSECGKISLKSNFHKKSRSKDGLIPHCRPCRKIYRKKFYNDNFDLEVNRRRKYRVDNKKNK